MKIKKVFLVILLCLICFLPVKCAGEQIKYKTAMHKATRIVKMQKNETLTYDYVVKQLGKPWTKTENYAEFFIKPDALIAPDYTSLFITFDEYGNIETAAILHAN